MSSVSCQYGEIVVLRDSVLNTGGEIYNFLNVNLSNLLNEYKHVNYSSSVGHK